MEMGKRVTDMSELASRRCREDGAGEDGRDRAVEITARLRASTCTRRWDSSVETARARPEFSVLARLSSPKMDSRWAKRSLTRR